MRSSLCQSLSWSSHATDAELLPLHNHCAKQCYSLCHRWREKSPERLRTCLRTHTSTMAQGFEPCSPVAESALITYRV